MGIPQGKEKRLLLLNRGLKGKASVSTDDLIPKTRHCRNQHTMAFQGSFFPQTIWDWNALPNSLISSAEDADNCDLIPKTRRARNQHSVAFQTPIANVYKVASSPRLSGIGMPSLIL